MDPDFQVCYCYHVPLRKLVNYANRVRPQRASQLSQCLGAGTGCGWCIPILKKIHAVCSERPDVPPESVPASAIIELSPTEYAAARDAYRKSGQEPNTFQD